MLRIRINELSTLSLGPVLCKGIQQNSQWFQKKQREGLWRWAAKLKRTFFGRLVYVWPFLYYLLILFKLFDSRLETFFEISTPAQYFISNQRSFL